MADNTQLLRKLRDELASIQERYKNWREVEGWIAKTRAVVAMRFHDAVGQFDALANVRWAPVPMFTSSTPVHEIKALIDAANQPIAQRAVGELLGFLDGLMMLGD